MRFSGLPTGYTATVTDRGDDATDSDGLTVDASGSAVGPLRSGADGSYRFDGLLPGVYRVRFADLPASCVATATDQGDDARDSDGLTAVSRALASGEHDPTLDFGVWCPPASLGDRVWFDTNTNGKQDPGEPGIPGITLRLRDHTEPGH